MRPTRHPAALRRAALRPAGILLALGLAACQPLPRPFSDDRPSRDDLLQGLRDSVGVTVERVSGAPPAVGDNLAKAMAAALRDAEIPASTVAPSRVSYVLLGTASERALDQSRASVAVNWELHDAEGQTVGTHAEAIEGHTAGWAEASPDLVTAIARSAAPAIAKLIQDEPPMAAPNDGRPTLRVRPVDGAPGDGGTALKRAMTAALGRAPDLVITEKDTPGTLLVACRVTVAPPVKGQQQVTVSWSLTRADGTEIGRVDQANAVPAGSLDRYWGDVAYVVANAAADGILNLLQRSGMATAEIP